MKVTIAADQLVSWESQVCQYPETGEPGVCYFAGEVGHGLPPVDCLLWRDEDGRVRGILNHYSVDYPPFEKAGNVNIFVQPGYQRRGIGTELVIRSVMRWGPINVKQQRYTEVGAAFARHLIGNDETS